MSKQITVMQQIQPGTSAERPMVMWRVTLHCWVEDHLGSYSATEVVAVEAPENDLQATAKAGLAKLATKRPHPKRCGITRIDVWRLDNRTPPSQLAQQNSLWNAATRPGEAR